ncbi:MAG: gfo/Idh/MocA family oxidoreductase [Verrucomicrobia bacterium]|nr:MAG: gfo/Idh/MocA family oxidoreductase [Verrucomicrobiota bacterium]
MTSSSIHHRPSPKPSSASRSPALSRRSFLARTGLAVGAISLVPRHVLGGPKFVAPSEKVNIAIIGCGGQGQTNVRELFNHNDAQIIAVADPIETQDLHAFYFKSTAGRLPVKEEIEKHYSEKTPNYKVADYQDFREMLEKEKAIDAILCATPDHQHAYVCVTAMRHGKHAYCEKPLTHNVWEARQMSKVARETGVATQMGNQGHSGDFIRQTCEMIWDGAIGDVREVHAWTSAGRWNKKQLSGQPSPEPTPKGVNWDLWLGPRESRPYSALYNPVTWRDFWDFGTAPIGDFFCHNFDPACWALDLKEPISIEASAAGGVDAYIAPVGGLYTYHFGPRGKMPAVKFMWYEGGLMPERPEVLEPDDQLGANGNGILFVGDKGMLTCPGWAGRPLLLPGSKDEAYKRPPATLPRVKGHHRDWLDACKGGKPASSNFQYGAALTEVGLLGLVAMRVKKKIYWDAKAMKATNAPEADKLLKESYRSGWEIPA